MNRQLRTVICAAYFIIMISNHNYSLRLRAKLKLSLLFVVATEFCRPLGRRREAAAAATSMDRWRKRRKAANEEEDKRLLIKQVPSRSDWKHLLLQVSRSDV